jgi:hypothetical protein
LRDTIARSLGALLVCRQVRTDPAKCPELAELIAHWDGRFTVLMRKRAARHIDGCPMCEEQRAGMVTPAALLGSTPVLIPAPAWLRGHALTQSAPMLTPTPAAPATGGAAHTPGSDGSWWPQDDLDTTDLPDGPRSNLETPSDTASQSGGTTRFLKRHVWAAIGVAGVVVAGGAAAVGVPQMYSVHPAVSTEHPSTPPASVTPTAPRPSGNVAKTGSPSSPTTAPPSATESPGGSRSPIQPPETNVVAPTPPTGGGRPSEPSPGEPSKPSAPPGNSGGPSQPSGDSGGSGQPPGGSSGSSGPGGSSGGSGSGSGSSGGSSGGSSQSQGGSGGGPVGPPTPPGAGRTRAPGHPDETRLGGSNDCVPPACIPTSGPVR